MTFPTHHLEWAAASVVALYKCDWQIEVFFSEPVGGHSFARLWAVTRAALWLRLDLGGARTGVIAGLGGSLWDSRGRGQTARSLCAMKST